MALSLTNATRPGLRLEPLRPSEGLGVAPDASGEVRPGGTPGLLARSDAEQFFAQSDSTRSETSTQSALQSAMARRASEKNGLMAGIQGLLAGAENDPAYTGVVAGTGKSPNGWGGISSKGMNARLVNTANEIFANFAGMKAISGVRNTKIAGTNKTSEHAHGNAIDIQPLDWARTRASGDAVTNWLIANHQRLGVVYFIWRGRQWSPSRGWSQYRYWNHSSPTQRHDDHLHIETR